MKPVVLHAKSPYLPVTETFIHDILVRLRDHRPVFVTRWTENPERYPFEALYSIDGLPPLRILRERLAVLLRNEYPYFEQVLRERGAALVHAHFLSTAILFKGIRRRSGVPLLVSCYGRDIAEFGGYRGHEDLFEVVDRVHVLSEDMARDVVGLGCPREKVAVIRLGIDLAQFAFAPRAAPAPGEPIRILSVGRFMPKKGLPQLVEAFAEVRRRVPAARLRLVGDGPDRPPVEGAIRRHGLADAVELPGYVPFETLPGEMARAHVFVLNSMTGPDGDKDEISMVVKEALATGLPVVTTRHAGIPETFPEGRGGVLVPECDTRALASAIVDLVEAPDRWPALAEEGRRAVAREHDLDRQVARIEGLYRELIAGARER